MRVPTLLAAVLLPLSAAALNAQDLQYRMTMQTMMPAMPANVPATTMTMSIKGQSMRMDMTVPGTDATMSTIIDVPNKKIFMLRHSDRIYTEMPYTNAMNRVSNAPQQWKEWKPVFKETGEKKVIDGRTARRIVQSVNMRSLPQMPGITPPGPEQKLVMVVESWLADDPKLLAAYNAFNKAMSSGQPDPFTLALQSQVKPGFPLAMRIMMLHLPEAAAVNAEAILKAGDRAQGLKMQTTMTVDQIKVGNLSAAQFAPPKGYTKQ